MQMSSYIFSAYCTNIEDLRQAILINTVVVIIAAICSILSCASVCICGLYKMRKESAVLPTIER